MQKGRGLPHRAVIGAEGHNHHLFEGSTAMNRSGWLQRLYWTCLAKPQEDRPLYRFLLDRPFRSILEVGMGAGQRTRRIAQLVEVPPDVEKIRYIGTDEFESANDGKPHLHLKDAHRMAAQLGFRAWLIPGPPESAVVRVAHKFGPSDLVILNGGLDPAHPHQGPLANWLEHIAHEGSVILASSTPGGPLATVALPSTAPLHRAA
ncbi:MAG: hypothetical protein D6753_07880 [Planctomycetota bacterium]|nr:MAG: hypothetical protein D6753_07880 [Planctomycetota bacterium]